MVHLAIRIVFLFHCIVFFAHCIAYKKTHRECKSKITKLDAFTFALSVRSVCLAFLLFPQIQNITFSPVPMSVAGYYIFVAVQ